VFGEEGVYRCAVVARFSTVIFSDPYTLYISPEGSVSVFAEPSQQLYTEGDSIFFNCSAQGGPGNEFQWQLNGVNLTTETSPVLDRPNIMADSDGGVYTCVVGNDAGSDEDSFTVNVSPVITLQPGNISTQVTEVRSLECNATGFPAPTYQWFKVGGDFGETVSGDNTSVLRFNTVNYGDEGDYFCQVTSGNATINSSVATLAVSPRGTVVISPTNGSFSIGEDVNLTCSAMGGPRNIFQWFRSGVELEGENSTVLSLTNIALEDGTEYTCGVRNIGQRFDASTFVLINLVVTVHPTNFATTNGTNAMLECEAEAFPSPTYQWTYSNGSEITLNSVTGVETTTLQFLPAVFGSEGEYVCTATANNVTATSDEAILFLSPRGTVMITPNNVTASTGDDIILTCSALGGPDNRFRWEQEAMPINVTTPSLVLSDITISEGGNYMCIVNNTAGEGSATATVFIRPIITSAEDILTTNGSSVEFVCEADGIPSPNVTWQRIGDSSNTTVSTSSTYVISPAVFGDEGDYQCVATSDVGTATQRATLTSTPY
jgi:hypothetical protein